MEFSVEKSGKFENNKTNQIKSFLLENYFQHQTVLKLSCQLLLVQPKGRRIGNAKSDSNSTAKS